MSGAIATGAGRATTDQPGPGAPPVSAAVVIRPESGGVAFVAGQVADELRRRGATVTELIGADEPSGTAAGAAFAQVWRARRTLRSADAVHVEVGRTALGALWLALWAAVWRDDLVVVVHDGPELVHAPGRGLIRTAPGRRDAIAHRILSPATDRLLRWWLRRRVAQWVTLSDDAARTAEAAGLTPVAVTHLGAAVDGAAVDGAAAGAAPTPAGTAATPAGRAAVAPSAGRSVLFAGYLAPTKGLEVLAEAWAEAGAGRDETLTVVGGHSRQHDGYVADLRARFAAGPASVRWRGWLDEEAFAAELAGAALVVLPYRASNPVSGVLVRALAAGRPVVVTRVPAVASLTDAQRAALVVVEADDASALAGAITALLDDPEQRDLLGRAAAAAAGQHTVADQVDEVVALHRSVEAGRRAPARRSRRPGGSKRSVGPGADGQRQRVLLVSPVFPPAHGGIESLASGIASGLGRRVAVVTLREPGSEAWDETAPFPVSRAGNEPRGGRRAILRLNGRAVIRGLAFRPDVIVSMHVRGAYGARVVARLSGARWVQLYHAKEILEFPRATAVATAHADAHVVPSRYTRRLVAAAGVALGEIRVVPPAVGPLGQPQPPAVGPLGQPQAPAVGSLGQPRPQPPAAAVAGSGAAGSSPPARRPNSLVTVSRLADAYKGHDVIIEALATIRRTVPDVRWTVVGDGPLRPRLQHRVRAAGLDDHVRWLGALPDAERDDVLASSDVFVMPSRVTGDGLGGEGFGIVYLEAAAHGLPVVAGNEGGGVDAVDDGVTGVLVDPRDADAVAAAVTGLLTDRERLEGMRAEAVAWAASFTWPRFLDAIRAAIDGVANQPS